MKGLVGRPQGRLRNEGGGRGFRAPRRQVIEPKLNHNYQLILSVKFGRRGGGGWNITGWYQSGRTRRIRTLARAGGKKKVWSRCKERER